jgi:hypothetical protein
MPVHKQTQLIYQGSRDGFKTKNFSEKSFGLSPTYLLIKSKEHQ